MARSVLPPLPKSRDGCHKSELSPTVTQTCWSNSGGGYPLARMWRPLLHLNKTHLVPAAMSHSVLWGHTALQKNNKNTNCTVSKHNIVVLLLRSSATICWRFHSRRCLSRPTPKICFVRWGNGFGWDQLTSQNHNLAETSCSSSRFNIRIQLVRVKFRLW